MLVKTLLHKTLPDTYGHINGVDGEDWEIYHMCIPDVYPMTATLNLLREFFQEKKQEMAAQQLEDYDLIVIEVKPYQGQNTNGSNEFGHLNNKSYLADLVMFTGECFSQKPGDHAHWYVKYLQYSDDTTTTYGNDPLTPMEVVDAWMKKQGFG